MRFFYTVGAVGLGSPAGGYGNNLAIRRTALEDVGGFESIGFSLTEDAQLIAAVRRTGRWQVAVCPFRPVLVYAQPQKRLMDAVKQEVRWSAGAIFGTDFTTDDGRAMVGNLIFANTSLPARVEQAFETMCDNQHSVPMKVFESDFTNPETDRSVEERFCTMLEDRSLEIHHNWPKGTTITVVFDVDAEGILSVHAHVGDEALDFTLRIQGVKSGEELSESINNISKAIVE